MISLNSLNSIKTTLGWIVLLTLAAATAAARQAGGAPQSYRVGVGDTIAVDGFQHREISGSFLVDESGAVTYPLLGMVNVAGLTTTEIARHLEQLLEKDFYVDVQLQVDVATYRSKSVTLLGAIQKPGMYYLQGPTTLTQILADAGGFQGEVGPTLEVRRQELEGGAEVQRIYTFSTEKVTQGEEGGDFAIIEGDVLSVSARQTFFVSGEIASSGQFEITIGMTLMQAITTAGGLGKFASQEVELHREVDGEKQILEFNYARIRKGKDEDPPIRSGDVIIVKRRFF